MVLFLNPKVQFLLNFNMLYKLHLDRKNRLLYFQFEKLSTMLKYVKVNCFFSLNHKLIANFILQELPRNCSIVRLHNYCQYSGRSRGIVRMFGVSRIRFRELVIMGNFSGIYMSR